MKKPALKKDEKLIQDASLEEIERLMLEMKPSGKINDIHTIRLFLLGIISKLKALK